MALSYLLQYLATDMALSVQKFCGGLFLSEFVSGYFKTNKGGGGGYGLIGRATRKKELFCGFPKPLTLRTG